METLNCWYTCSGFGSKYVCEQVYIRNNTPAIAGVEFCYVQL